MTQLRQSGVLVLGMHRSGTSATTGALVAMGLSAGRLDSLKGPSRINERGFYEQLPLRRLNDQLLERLGGSWSGPPELEPGWAASSELDDLREEAGRSVSATYLEAPWVWKDPRTCLTLPFWRTCLAAEPLAVLVLRDPGSIVASMCARERMTEAYALALWERYMRSALLGAAGLPVLVTDYRELIEAPGAWARTASAFLASHGVRCSPDAAAVESFVEPGLCHHPADDLTRLPLASPAQTELARVLTALRGAHDRLEAPPLPAESRPTQWLIAERRRADGVERELRRKLALRSRASRMRSLSRRVRSLMIGAPKPDPEARQEHFPSA